MQEKLRYIGGLTVLGAGVAEAKMGRMKAVMMEIFILKWVLEQIVVGNNLKSFFLFTFLECRVGYVVLKNYVLAQLYERERG